MSKEAPIPSQFPTLTSTLGFGFCRGETHGPQAQFNSPMLPDLQRYRNCTRFAAPTARDPEGFPGGQQCREKAPAILHTEFAARTNEFMPVLAEPLPRRQVPASGYFLSR